MDKNPIPECALTFGLATFHTVFFILLLVVILFSLGSLGTLLESLNTLVGYVIFGALWATTWWTSGKALGRYDKAVNQADGENWIAGILNGKLELGRIIASGMLWGGVNGFLFLIVLAAILLIYLLVLTVAAILGGATNPGGSVSLVLIALIGSPVGAVVGGVAGFILALVDAAVLGLVRDLFWN